ncbi:MAG: GIY-YIG nuclease family protein [Bacteroidota bacterium]|nr:GIY-YIG nuclease family protein [Bacteroidota bacterium]
MEYLVYIIYSPLKDTFYVGYTSDTLTERIRRHNSNHKGFTGKSNDWELKYFEKYPTKELALKREREIKSWKSKKRIAQLVQGIPY